MNVFERVFVTVGTTEFDNLIRITDTEIFIKFLNSKQCKHLTVQIGRGEMPHILEELCQTYHIQYEWYRYKDNINEDIYKSNLIISHAGAGTIMECLDNKKIMIVCVNNTLQNNHQTELADQMAQDGYLIATYPEALLQVLATDFYLRLCPYPDPDLTIFPAFIKSILSGK